MSRVEVVAPVAEVFVQFEGQPTGPQFAKHSIFRGVSLRCWQYLVPEPGRSDAQAAASIEAAIQSRGCRDIVLQDCEVAHIGTYAVWFWRGAATAASSDAICTI